VNYYAESARAEILHHERYQPDPNIVEAIEQGFLFINFNKIDKLDPNVFSIWMSILRRVPKSSLLLLDPSKSHEKSATSDEIKKNILSATAAHGIQRHRVLFAPR
jgi:predicted O-linked N-acetylglucosamine transferase (SPINDLY family)